MFVFIGSGSAKQWHNYC